MLVSAVGKHREFVSAIEFSPVLLGATPQGNQHCHSPIRRGRTFGLPCSMPDSTKGVIDDIGGANALPMHRRIVVKPQEFLLIFKVLPLVRTSMSGLFV